MEFMAEMPDNFIDLAVPDLEYGIGEAGKNHKTRNTLVRQSDGVTMRRCPSTNYSRKDWDDKVPPDEVFQEINRVSENQCYFGANYFKYLVGTTFKPPRRKDFDSFVKDYPKGWIVWDKVNGTSDFSDCELIYTSYDFDSYVLPFMWAGMMQARSIKEGTIMQGNKRMNEKRIHPCHKPVVIYERLYQIDPSIKSVLDTGTGGGSSRIAAHKLGIDFYGCEKDSEYYIKSNKRYENFISQTSFDFGTPRQ